MKFTYTARDNAGAEVRGALEAASRREALQVLGRRGLRPLALGEGSGAARRASAPAPVAKAEPVAPPKPSVPSTLRRKHQLPFLTALCELVLAGIPVGDAVRTLSVRLREPALRQLAGTLWTQVSEGRTIAQAMGDLPRVFDDATVRLVEAGEATGNLRDILPRLVKHYEEQQEVRNNLVLTLAYPAFLLTVAGGVIVLFLYYLLPKMQVLFTALRGELPASTKLLVALSQFSIHWGPFLLGAAVVGGIAFWQWRRTEAGRLTTDTWLTKVPGVSRFVIDADLLQAVQTLAVLLANGVTVLEGLRLASQTMANRRLRVAFQGARTRVAEGASLSLALQETQVVPPLVLDMLGVGEQTGNLVPGLESIARNLDRTTSRRTKAFLQVFATSVLLFTFVLVGFMAFAIVSAVFGLSASFTT